MDHGPFLLLEVTGAFFVHGFQMLAAVAPKTWPMRSQKPLRELRKLPLCPGFRPFKDSMTQTDTPQAKMRLCESQCNRNILNILTHLTFGLKKATSHDCRSQEAADPCSGLQAKQVRIGSCDNSQNAKPQVCAELFSPILDMELCQKTARLLAHSSV